MELMVNGIPLKDGSTYAIDQDDIDTWKMLYANVDIDQEFKNMLGWTLANPSKAKTRRGIKKFINSWLCRANKGVPNGPNSAGTSKTIVQRQSDRGWAQGLEH